MGGREHREHQRRFQKDRCSYMVGESQGVSILSMRDELGDREEEWGQSR